MSPQAYLLDPSVAAVARVGMVVDLAGTEGEHAARVARVRQGEAIDLVDGRGMRLQAVVQAVGRDRVSAQVLGIDYEPAPDPAFIVVQALPKGEHADLAVDQLTQAGVDRIVPWAAARCVVRWDEQRAAKGQAKWQQAAAAAAKQSRRSRIPQVGPLARMPEVLQEIRHADLAVVLHGDAADPLAELDLPATGAVVIVVGPEGGLAEDELEGLTGAGARPARLGPGVLRTSLAGAMALALLSGQGRWRAAAPPDASAPVMQGWQP